MTIETYATLINKRLVLPSQKTNYAAVETHFLVTALQPQLGRIFLDEAWYLRRNPDVVVAIKDGAVADARAHYVLHGYYEHRLPYEIVVEESWYLAQYADIAQAVRGGVFPDGQTHFEQQGYREGRMPFAGFVLKPA